MRGKCLTDIKNRVIQKTNLDTEATEILGIQEQFSGTNKLKVTFSKQCSPVVPFRQNDKPV